MVFKNWQYVLPEDGKHILKHVGEVHLMFILIKNGIWLVNKWCMLRFISTSFVIMLISTTQAPCVKKVKPQRTGQASKTTNIVASVEAQLSYYCSSCRSLLIPPHSQDILMLPMQVNDKWENTTIMFIA